MAEPWRLAGDVVVSCNCDVFCPCVLSLGRARPSQGRCYAWFGFRVREGHAGPVELGGLTMGLMLEVPGPMEQGNWTVGLYLPHAASPEAEQALTAILTGQAGGPPGWWSLMIATCLPTRRAAVLLERAGRGWRFAIPGVADAVVEPIPGADGDGIVRITNSRYWMASDVVVATTAKSRFRDHGRNWNLGGGSAEFAAFDWRGP